MDLIFVRHGESAANAEGRLQGQGDYPLTRRGRAQAVAVARWTERMGINWDYTYCSPLSRARDTAELITRERGLPPAIEHQDFMEFDVGRLQGLLYVQVRRRHPEFFERRLEQYADYSPWGGESYQALQDRVARAQAHLEARHRQAAARVLIVGHGGFGTQWVKHLLCYPVPRACHVKFGNCTAMLVRMSEGYGSYFGQLMWQVPVELMQR